MGNAPIQMISARLATPFHRLAERDAQISTYFLRPDRDIGRECAPESSLVSYRLLAIQWKQWVRLTIQLPDPPCR